MYLALEARKRIRARSDPALRAELDAAPPITVRHLLMLGVPSIFDLVSVVLLVSGLMHVPASMWMLLRGGCIVFVALMKQYVLRESSSRTCGQASSSLPSPSAWSEHRP